MELTADTVIRLDQIKDLLTWRLTSDKHSNYRTGDIAEWKDGLHQKTVHGWIKIKEEKDRYNENIGEIKSLNQLTEKHFTHPKNSLKLPSINSEIWRNEVNDNRKVLLKKFVIERMNKVHNEIKEQGLNHRDVLVNAIYNSDKIMRCKPQEFPYYYATVKKADGGNPIKIETKNCVSVLDISPENKYIEVVDWRWIGKKGMKNMENKERRNKTQ